jgi:DNA-directed RNA polymerase subunit E'/Rpb7
MYYSSIKLKIINYIDINNIDIIYIMSAISEPTKIKIKSSGKKKKIADIYSSALLTRHVSLPIIYVGQNIKETLKSIIINEIEGKCIAEGYIKPDSITIITYSNGVIDGANINFEVIIECSVCNPVEGMNITGIVKNITKAGIRAQFSEENNPLVIFIARDHNYMSKYFTQIQENEEIKIRVIGQRFELNDTYISIIGELLESKGKGKPKIQVVSSEKSILEIPHTVIADDEEISPITDSLQSNPEAIESQ